MRDVLRILVSPLVWLASFSAVYGLHGLICGYGIGGVAFTFPLPRALLIAAYAVGVLLQMGLLASFYHRRFASASKFTRFVSRATGWTGLVATVWSLFPAVMTTYCQ